MTPEQIERAISKASRDVMVWQASADATNDAGDYVWQQQCLQKAHEAAAEVGRMVGMRSAETVERMELGAA